MQETQQFSDETHTKTGERSPKNFLSGAGDPGWFIGVFPPDTSILAQDLLSRTEPIRPTLPTDTGKRTYPWMQAVFGS
jgi:hypothetical protein